MPEIEQAAAWVEASRLATMIGESMWLIASLSAVHVVGYTLVIGGAVVANLRWMGLLLPQLSVADVTRDASRGIALGLAISVVTGLLLASWKAAAVVSNHIFQLKMLLLASAVVLHFSWQRSARTLRSGRAGMLRATGAIGLALWVGLALAGCAFILLE